MSLIQAMSKFFKAMSEAARHSSGPPSLPLLDLAGLGNAATITPEAPVPEAVGQVLGKAVQYRRVSTQPMSSTVLPPLNGHYTRAADQYRIIRTKIVQHPASPRLLAISSAGIGDGKTINAINIAGAVAMKENTSVLLVDADFRRSRVAEALGIEPSPGLADVLRGDVPAEEAIVQLEPNADLHVLPAGEAPPNPAELLDSPRWGALCQAFRNAFDYVIIDAPPVGLVADYDLIQAVVDATIQVVRVDHSIRDHSLRASKVIPKQKLLGLVMNAVPDWFLTRSMAHDYRYYQREKRRGQAQTNEPNNGRQAE